VIRTPHGEKIRRRCPPKRTPPLIHVVDQSRILETTPEPTVRPPSRMAKRTPSSMAIGTISSTSIFTLSPGETISTPPISLVVPVTSVVRK